MNNLKKDRCFSRFILGYSGADSKWHVYLDGEDFYQAIDLRDAKLFIAQASISHVRSIDE